MSRFLTPPTAGKSKQEQFPVLAPGIYLGFLSSYSMPYDDEYQGKKSTKMRWTFIVSHTAFGKLLPAITKASKAMTMAMTYNPDTGMISNKFALYHALTTREFPTREALYEALLNDIDSVPDEDAFVGRPAILTLEPSKKNQESGIQYNNVVGIAPLTDADLKKIALEYYRKFEYGTTKDGLRHLTSPAPKPIEEGPKPSALPPSSFDDEFDSEEIPF